MSNIFFLIVEKNNGIVQKKSLQGLKIKDFVVRINFIKNPYVAGEVAVGSYRVMGDDFGRREDSRKKMDNVV